MHNFEIVCSDTPSSDDTTENRPESAEEKHEAEATEKGIAEKAKDAEPAAADSSAEQSGDKPAGTPAAEADKPTATEPADDKKDESESKDVVPPLNEGML